MDYNAILRSMDQAASGTYSFASPTSVAPRTGVQFQGDVRFAGPDIGSRNDANAVQAVPRTVPMKHYVVIDASQRNWVQQPNPYSNLVYSFGSQALNGYSPPVYTNNSFIPTFGADSNGVLNTQPGKPNTSGWYLPGTSLTFYPAYNSSLPKGNFLAYDTGYTVNPSGLGFGSVFLPSNVQSIKLVRALLPQRQFIQVPILVNSSSSAADLSNYGDGGTIQKAVVGTSFSTFSTYPYLLFNLNEYLGKYVGGNEAMRRSFSVMTQRTRTQTNFSIGVGVQHYDYEPWNDEALVFQSPITTLQQLKISVTDPIGLPFAQNDALNITLIQTDSNQLFLKCITGASQYFSSNELRVGDRIIFDQTTLSNIIKAPLFGGTSGEDKRALAVALSTTSFPVLQLLDYVKEPETGRYVERTASNNTLRSTSYEASYNGFIIPNFLNTAADGSVSATYSNAPDPNTYTLYSFPVQYNVNPAQFSSNLPFLNTSLQPTYTLELTCLEPDTGQLGGKITQ
jgi:hypothetical protein